MKILKFFLYFVCFVATSWICLFFGGPSIIKRVIESYTGSQVKVYNVEVRPNLNVKIGRLELETFVSNGEAPIKGFMRAIEIAWYFSKGRPFVEITTGPTVVDELFVADGLKIFISEFPSLSLDSVPISIEVKDLLLSSLGRADSLSLDGAFSKDSYSILGFLFETNNVVINSANNATVGSISGTVSDIKLDQPLSDQALKLNFAVTNVMSLQPQVEIKNLNGNFNHKVGLIGYNLSSEEIIFPAAFSSFGFTALNGFYEMGDNGFTSEGTLHIKGANLFDDKINFEDFSGAFNVPIDQSFNAQASGAVGRFELVVNEQYVGQLPEGSFKMDIAIEKNSASLVSEAGIAFMSDTTPAVQIENEFKASLKNISSVIECVVNKCEVSGLDLSYVVSLGNERISGNSFCDQSKCSPRNWNHKIRTFDTNKFFEVLSDLEIINPLTLAYVYASFLSGIPLDDGHELNL